jgi:WD40 repeat protein/transcriptional regulator with XRE-family HTH domain
MAGWQVGEHSDESFQSLLLRHRGRTGLTQRELADRVGVSPRAVQMWEAGTTYPSAAALQSLIRAFMEADGLHVGHETQEVEELWSAALRDGPRMRTPLDRTWLAELQPARAETAFRTATLQPTPLRTTHQDWGEAPDVRAFVGRDAELAELHEWVIRDRCRMLVLVGLGGMGKTILAARLAQEVADDFEVVFWRSLRNAPSPSEWLGHAIGFLSSYEALPPDDDFARREMLLHLLRERRCLLVLDNLETVLVSDERGAETNADFAGFRSLVQTLAETAHQSCVLVTSREAPAELAHLRGETGPVRMRSLGGLSTAEARALLGEEEIWGDDAAWASLVETYAGNGLALKVTRQTIHQVFGGDIAAFIAYVKETYGTAVRGIRRLMDAQVERRLSALELHVLRWLAIEREPVTFLELMNDLGPAVGRSAAVDALESLRRRSLVERSDRMRAFTLQSVVLEYVTDRLVEQAGDEIARGEPETLATYPLVKAQAKEYVRRSQERLAAQPLLERLASAADGSQGAEQQLVALLEQWRSRREVEHRYGPGNVVNLLRLLRGSLRGMDLSGLSIKQAYLQGVEMQDASLDHAYLSEAVLADAFDPILSVAVNADARVVAAGTMGGEVRLWNVDHRSPLASVHGHTGSVYGVALSADGHVLLSGAVDGRVQIWDTRTGVSLAAFAGHVGGTYGVALGADSHLAASCGVDGAIRIWSVDDRANIKTLLGHEGVVYDIAFTSDAQRLVSGGQDGTVRLWEPSSGACLLTLHGHAGPVRGVAASADGQLLASGGLDGTVRLWDSAGGTCLAVLQGHISSVWSVSLTPDGRLLASSGVDGSVRLWDVASNASVATLQGHSGAVWSVALDADGRSAASGGVDGAVRVWENETGQCIATVQGNTSLIRGVAMRADGHQVVSSGVDGTIRLWDVSGGSEELTVREAPGSIYNLGLTSDGSLLATGELDGRIRLRELATGKNRAIVQAHTGAAYGVAINADGSLMASGGIDATVRLWQVQGAKCLATLHGHVGAVWGVALDADGRILASGGQDGTIRVWDPSIGTCLRQMRANSGTIYCVALSGDGQLLASGGLDGSIRLWDLATGECLRSIDAEIGVLRGVALSGDGQLLAGGGQDGTVRLWQAHSGMLVRILHPDRLYQRLDITGLTGVSDVQRAALLALGAVERKAS